MSNDTLSQSKASGTPLDLKSLHTPSVKEVLNTEDSRPAVTCEKAICSSSADNGFGWSDLLASLFEKSYIPKNKNIQGGSHQDGCILNSKRKDITEKIDTHLQPFPVRRVHEPDDYLREH